MYLVVSQNTGNPKIHPQNTIVLIIMGTPRKAPNFGKPPIHVLGNQGSFPYETAADFKALALQFSDQPPICLVPKIRGRFTGLGFRV